MSGSCIGFSVQGHGKFDSSILENVLEKRFFINLSIKYQAFSYKSKGGHFAM